MASRTLLVGERVAYTPRFVEMAGRHHGARLGHLRGEIQCIENGMAAVLWDHGTPATVALSNLCRARNGVVPAWS